MTISLYRRMAVAFALLAALSSAPVLLGQTQGQPETLLLSIAGTVEIAPAGTPSWSPGHANQILHNGDQLRSGKNSRAILRLSDQSVFRVYELTTMTIGPAPKAGQNQVIEVKSGAAYFFNRDKPNQTQFQTPSSSGAIRGTEFNLAVAEDGSTTLSLLDGQVDLSNHQGSIQVESGEQAVVEVGKAPRKTALIDAVNVIQWTLYYPAILDPDELELTASEKSALARSLDAYRAGDLLNALAQFPDRGVDSESVKVYHAALLLAVGNVNDAEALLNQSAKGSRASALADALREMIAAVKGQSWNRSAPRVLATEWLAGSYQAQARRDLAQARQMARSAVAKSPDFGFAQEHLAEMEFSFGRSEAASAALNRSLDLSPRNAQAVALKGFVLSGQNKIREAGYAFDKAIEIDGSLANGWLGRGLIDIHERRIKEGRQELETAAALEPNRAFLRSYLGKAWSLDLPGTASWDAYLATKELGLAMRLDPNDPTAWLYSALLSDQRNSINQAIGDLEHSEALNDNRAVFRSKYLLDQDAAVRAANLALIYEDAGLSDVATREATKSVEDDYANYSAHLFLSDGYAALQDPTKENLRYQTPWEDELLVANLLAPVGAGILSQSVSQQEYSKLFASDGPGIFSQTEFFSRGAWMENGAQYGTVENVSYSLNAYYYSDPGWRPNNDIENSDFSAQVKYQFDPKDTAFLEVEATRLDAGDVLEHYNYNTPTPGLNNERINLSPDYDPSLRQTEIQDPNILFGYHRDWGTGNHTVLLYRGLQDYFTANDANYGAPLLASDLPSGVYPHGYSAATELKSTTELNSAELQHIFQSDTQTIIVGTRFQAESIQTANQIQEGFSTESFGNQVPPMSLPSLANVNSDFERFSLYGYYQLKLFDRLRLTGGAAYDWERFPLNIADPPLSSAEDERGRLSPKAGLDWMLPEGTRVRADYTRSMSGLLNDSSTLIEPSQVGGFNQEFRSLIPESAGKGTPPATLFETWGLGLDHKFPTRTYVDVEGQLLTSRGGQLIGAWSGGAVAAPVAVENLPQSQYFQEKDTFASISQLISSDLSVGASYTLTAVDLSTHVTTPPGTVPPNYFDVHEDSTLNKLSFFANFYVPCGFFSQFQANWWKQENIGSMGEPGDSFAQFNLYAGYRFPKRHVEMMIGVVNIGNQDYHIDPVTYFLEQAHTRTLVASFKFNF
jgi:hypothetical protein